MAFTTASAARNYLTAGRARVALVSDVTQDHMTFKVKKAKGKDFFFVSVLGKHDAGLNYMGILTNRGEFKVTPKGKLAADSVPVRAFTYFTKHLQAGHIAPKLTVRAGCCGKCGKPLTHPESLDTGFGPECIKKFGGR